MPRIPARTEPYQNSARQQRHYKTKRDQTLKALEKAAYIGRSHFAILFVNARGQVECYSTKLLAPRLDDWFNRDVIAQAEELVKSQDDNDRVILQNTSPGPSDDTRDRSSSLLPETPSRPGEPLHEVLPPNFPVEAIPFCSRQGVSDAYYLKLFHARMTNDIIKNIGKSWVHAVQPGKHTVNPFSGGEDMKPNWWPRDIVHKDPSHLRKPEGASLLLAVIRSGLLPMKELASLTFASNYIRGADKNTLNLLHELFVVAQEDELLRREAEASETDARTEVSEIAPTALFDQYATGNVQLCGGSAQTAEEVEMWNNLIDDTQMGSPIPLPESQRQLSITEAFEKEPNRQSNALPQSPTRRPVPIAFDSPFAVRKKEAGKGTEFTRTPSRISNRALVATEARQPVARLSARRSGLVFLDPSQPTGASPEQNTSQVHTSSASDTVAPSSLSPKRNVYTWHQPSGRREPNNLDSLPQFVTTTPLASPDAPQGAGTVMMPRCGDAPFLTPCSQTPFTVYGDQVSDGYLDYTPGSAWSDGQQRMTFLSSHYPITFAFSDGMCSAAGAATNDTHPMLEYFPQVGLVLPVQDHLAPTRSASTVSQHSGSSATFKSSHGGDDTPSYLLQPPAEIIERQPVFHNHMESNDRQAAPPYESINSEGHSWVMI